MARVLHCTRFFYLDSTNGASIANRALLECLARHGFEVEALCGSVVDANPGGDPAAILGEFDSDCRAVDGWENDVWTIGTPGVRMADPPHLVARLNGVPVTALRRSLHHNLSPDATETGEFLSLFDSAFDRLRPDVLVTYGGDPLTREILSRARRRGVATVFTLHNFAYPEPAHFADVDAILVPSRFSAEYHRRILGIDCVALPYLIDRTRVRADRGRSSYVTLVNASAEKGVFPFVRIADELGKRRPDIPFLVVESRGTESQVADCGIDLRPHGNVFLMSQTSDPRDFWRVTRVCLMPSLWWESQGLVAVEAMINGIPVIASDRGALPETLGDAGIVLPLPERLTAFTRELPTAEEVGPWVEAIIRLWDDADCYAERSRLSILESERWSPDELEPLYVEFFDSVRTNENRPLTPTDRLPHTCEDRDSVVRLSQAIRSRSDFGELLNARGLLGIGAEVGVQNGYFSRQILDRWRGRMLYMIDIWQGLENYRDVANVPANEQVERMVRAIHQVSPHWNRVRILREMSENAARMVPDGSLDWVYIDANHDFDSVKRDLESWTPKVKEGGIVAGHDFLDGILLINGVETVFEVRRAVTEHFPHQKVDVTDEDFPTWFLTKNEVGPFE